MSFYQRKSATDRFDFWTPPCPVGTVNCITVSKNRSIQSLLTATEARLSHYTHYVLVTITKHWFKYIFHTMHTVIDPTQLFDHKLKNQNYWPTFFTKVLALKFFRRSGESTSKLARNMRNELGNLEALHIKKYGKWANWPQIFGGSKQSSGLLHLRCSILTISLCICTLFWCVFLQMCPQIIFSGGSKITLVAFVWLFSSVYSQMCPQMACPRWCKITLIAFVWFFSSVYFQMCPQGACLGGCKITLVAFVWFFSGVNSHMNFHNTFTRAGIAALIAYVWLFSAVFCQMCPQMACLRGRKVTLLAFVWFFATVCSQMCP